MPTCDCGAEPGEPHASNCMTWETEPQTQDDANQDAYQGY